MNSQAAFQNASKDAIFDKRFCRQSSQTLSAYASALKGMCHTLQGHVSYFSALVWCTVVGWQLLMSKLPHEKYCYGWLLRMLLRRCRLQSAGNCSTLWEQTAGSQPSTSQVILQIEGKAFWYTFAFFASVLVLGILDVVPVTEFPRSLVLYLFCEFHVALEAGFLK